MYTQKRVSITEDNFILAYLRDMPRITDKDFTFEMAMEELEEITLRLENGKDPLEESIQLYERGMLLKDFCEKKLREAESKWTILKKQKDGSVQEVELSRNEREELKTQSL